MFDAARQHQDVKQRQPTSGYDVGMMTFDEFVDEYPAPQYGLPDELIRRLLDSYIVSDSHFFHHNIIRMQNRPWNVDDLMMQRWNEVVDSDDPVLHCGDVVHRCTLEHITERLMPLNGHKYLIRGNHDGLQRAAYFVHRGWTLIHPFIAEYKEWTFMFTHRPVPPDQLRPFEISVHGHSHSTPPRTNRHVNVSVERMGYTPVRLGPLLEQAILAAGNGLLLPVETSQQADGQRK